MILSALLSKRQKLRSSREHVSVILMHRQETTSMKKATANTGRSALDTSSDRKTMNMAMSARSIKMWLNLV